MTDSTGWQNQILLGDCLQILPILPDSSVDLIITSPPYAKVLTVE